MYLLFNFAVLSFLLNIVAVNGTGQSRLSDKELLAAAREIIIKARFGTLITHGHDGQLQARTIDPFEPEEQMVVWFATNPRTRKVMEMTRDSPVTLYFFDREDLAYVTLKGRARLVNDAQEKQKRWKEEWKEFYPNRDRDYLLVKVTPLKIEVVNTAKGILGNPRTWRPPTVRFISRQKIKSFAQ